MLSDLKLVVVTGMSGAGRSTVAHALEDSGYLVMDNIPPQLIGAALELMPAQIDRVAVVADARGGSLFNELQQSLTSLDQIVGSQVVVFLEASDHSLVRRFESSRRPHPIQNDSGLLAAIQSERQMLTDLRNQATLIIDTSETSIHELRREIEANFEESQTKLVVQLKSFGFKYGIPIDADMVLDVRFLPNPYWEPELRNLTGLDPSVAEYVFNQTGAVDFVDAYVKLLKSIASGYLREGKRFVTVAIGCTGGQHRSVAIAEKMSRLLPSDVIECVVNHRDRGRE